MHAAIKKSVSHLNELGDIERYVEQTRAGWSRETKKDERHIQGRMEGMGDCDERDKGNGRRWRVCIRLYAGSAAAASRGGAMDPASDRHTRDHVHAAIIKSVPHLNI